MKITFNAGGLALTAEVSYDPGIPAFTAGRPEDCYEGEGPEIEFYSLTYDGRDAKFLLMSDMGEAIYDAALEAAELKYDPAAG